MQLFRIPHHLPAGVVGDSGYFIDKDSGIRHRFVGGVLGVGLNLREQTKATSVFFFGNPALVVVPTSTQSFFERVLFF